MHPPIRFLTTSDGVTIACCSHSDGGQPFVFVRGWMSHLETLWSDPAFRAYFEPVARRFRLVRFDMRGTGLSDRVEDVGLDGMVLDLETVMDQLELEDVILYGQCFGGPAAVLYAARHPERVSKMILDGTYACGRRIATPEQQKSVLATLRDLPQAGYLYLAHMTHPDRSDATRPAAAKYVSSPEIVPLLYSLAFETDVTEVLAQINAPTLVMHRQRSFSIPFALGRELASQIRGARFVGLPGRAHDPWQEEPAAALAAVSDFLGTPLELASQPPLAPERTPVTVLFTDMEGSTPATQRFGDSRAQELVHAHNTIVRDALKTHAGREIKHTGDGIMASFASPTNAVECAIDIQRALASYNEGATDAVRVRIGMNAGEPVAEENDLFGTAVQMAARVCAHATPGQIVASNVVRELTAGKGFLFADLGDIALRGFEDPVRLYEVRWRTDPSG